MESDVKKRLGWIKLYESTANLGFVCRRCGISRPTLRKWVQRYRQLGVAGLSEHSRRPQRIKTKITPEDISNILILRKSRKLGHRSIVSEMKRLHGRSFSTATIQKILERHNCKYLKIKRGYRKKVNRYSRPVPGDRVQMDVCKIAPGLYQYTAIDDCSRFKVLALYPRRTAANTLRFLELVLEQMPFPIQRIQTDRGNEFFAEKFQKTLMDYSIKFRPVKPRSPHLNGKVERSQRTDLDEFYSTVDLKDPELPDLLSQWQFHYNWFRAHSSLSGKAPIDVVNSLSDKTPFWDEVGEMYDESKERLRVQNYRLDLQLNGVKRCL
ncbi:Homeodomain-like domain-containing protein [Parapedobacter composti]|uniref:Homeodomain-like domain-containing protein n=1 Tax=Parapedobacter composti TaxID=623281 RepID=A0A1I1MEG3_9SPHI|nr:IS481 family transposase [Parapedobacter composti]SFC83192.1 Homeodomain-like domain-containing protein [Parapedobacter composti]